MRNEKYMTALYNEAIRVRLTRLGTAGKEDERWSIMGSTRIDPYFYMQPPLSFVDELRKPLHVQKPQWFGRTKLQKGEVSVTGAFVINEFPDEEKLLDTAVQDFQVFLKVHEARGDQYPVKLVKGQTECFEAYHIRVSKDGCILEAEDTEGIRRALVYLEDEMLRREGAILPLGEISRKPVIRNRITRGFFSPTNRPPKNQDELLDDVDYYPEEYLNRLAHDGANGLWIYTHFKELLPSQYFTEYGKEWERRITKLRKVVDKCRRYGIKVYVFGVEPSSLKGEVAEKYRDATGCYVEWSDSYTVCTYSERGANYCIEATQKLCELVPNLGGIIDITQGERVTNCSTATDYCQCPRCRQHTKGEILAHTVHLLKEGIRRAGSNAEFISWSYGHREWAMEDIQDYVRCAPDDVMLMENFDDAGYYPQLGKTRAAIDYWLSYAGPSQMYEGAARTATNVGKHMFAKMQVCCSHELASVPYIPVPGLLFDKYAGAYRCGTEGVMQCWFFGNYPSLMSKAAGELSFMEDFSDKKQFLTHLAGIYYGSRAKEAAEAWEHFEAGYRNYPLNIMFSYYGPMHDGVVWELALLPKNTSLPRSWQIVDTPDGDRIGECLQAGHTLREAMILTDRMRGEWRQGLNLLPENGPGEQRSIAKALSILFASGNNILQFYELRALLAKKSEDIKEIRETMMILKQMEEIVDEEIRNSQEMIPLCEADPRLGYHSEAEGYKFFPKKLADRVEKLKLLKETEFCQVRQELTEGKQLFSRYLADEGPGYQMVKGDIALATYEAIADQGTFRISYDKEKLYVELKGKKGSVFKLYFEYQYMWPAPGIRIENGEMGFHPIWAAYQGVYDDKIPEELAKYELLESQPTEGHYILAISREKVGWTKDEPLKVMIVANEISWIFEENPIHTLGKNEISPGEFGWLWP